MTGVNMRAIASLVVFAGCCFGQAGDGTIRSGQSRGTVAPSATNAEVKGMTSEDREAARAAGRAGATIAGVGLGVILVTGLISLFLQLVPVAIAFVRGHPNRWAIAALSILLGWTCIGWIVAVIWSLTGRAEQVHYHYRQR